MNTTHHTHYLHKLPLVIDKKKTNIKCLCWYTIPQDDYKKDKVMLVTDKGDYIIDLAKQSLIINENNIEIHSCLYTQEYLEERRKDW